MVGKRVTPDLAAQRERRVIRRLLNRNRQNGEREEPRDPESTVHRREERDCQPPLMRVPGAFRARSRARARRYVWRHREVSLQSKTPR